MDMFHEVQQFYEAMSPWARRKFRETGRDYARTWPAPKNIPLLTLVVDQPAPSQLAPRGLDRDINQFPAILVRKSVDQ